MSRLSRLEALSARLLNMKLLIKADGYKKSKLVDWQPRAYSAQDLANMHPYLQAGHNEREAAHLSGVQHVSETHPNTRVTPFSEPMLTAAKQVANKHLAAHDEVRRSKASAAKNPHAHIAGKISQTHAKTSYPEDLATYKSSPDFKAMSPFDQSTAEVKFKKDWMTRNKDNNIAALKESIGAHGALTENTLKEREQEKHAIRSNIARGGVGEIEKPQEEISDKDLLNQQAGQEAPAYDEHEDPYAGMDEDEINDLQSAFAEDTDRFRRGR